MDVRKKKEGLEAKASGFTLIEVVIAIVILSLSLVTLLGMQASIIQQELRDQNRQSAMLAARWILSSLEANREGFEVGEQTGTVREVLSKIEAVKRDFEESEGLDFLAHLAVTEWEVTPQTFGIAIPPPANPASAPPPDKAKRVLLNINWGQDPSENIQVLYIIPED